VNVYVYRVHLAEFVERGSLYDFIHHNELDPERNLKWTKGIASGMALLHDSTMVTYCSQWGKHTWGAPSGNTVNDITLHHSES